MKKLQGIGENGLQCPESCCLRGILVIVKTGFHHLDVPVAELLPDEIVNLLHSDTEFVFVEVLSHFFCQMVNLGKNPFVCSGQVIEIHLCRNIGFLEVHHDKTGSVPYFVGEVTAGFHTIPVETHVVSGGVSGHKSQAERICAVFVDDFQRIDTVSEGFTHLSSLAVTNQSVNQYMMEGNLAGLLQRGEYHTDNPEKDDIVTRYQYVCREEIVQILGLVRPAQCGEGPEGGGEPGI